MDSRGAFSPNSGCRRDSERTRSSGRHATGPTRYWADTLEPEVCSMRLEPCLGSTSVRPMGRRPITKPGSPHKKCAVCLMRACLSNPKPSATLFRASTDGAIDATPPLGSCPPTRARCHSPRPIPRHGALSKSCLWRAQAPCGNHVEAATMTAPSSRNRSGLLGLATSH